MSVPNQTSWTYSYADQDGNFIESDDTFETRHAAWNDAMFTVTQLEGDGITICEIQVYVAG